MKNKILKILTITFMVFIIAIITNYVYASEFDTSDFADIYNPSGVTDITNKAGMILNVVQIGGTAISLIALLVLAMRYMLSSPDEKATIKEKLIPYVIGTIILFAASNLVAIVIRFAQGIS